MPTPCVASPSLAACDEITQIEAAVEAIGEGAEAGRGVLAALQRVVRPGQSGPLHGHRGHLKYDEPRHSHALDTVRHQRETMFAISVKKSAIAEMSMHRDHQSL